MHRHHISRIFAIALLLALAGVAQADSPPPALRSAITAGGGTLAVNGYALTGAIGQPLAGPLGQTGGYALTSGLFGGAGGPTRGNRVFLSMVVR